LKTTGVNANPYSKWAWKQRVFIGPESKIIGSYEKTVVAPLRNFGPVAALIQRYD
jgi:hypothetical protein